LQQAGELGHEAHTEAAHDEDIGAVVDAGLGGLHDPVEHLVLPARQIEDGAADHAFRHKEIADAQ
jgi:hypothetical protein